MSTRFPNGRERNLSPLERYIRQEDSRRAIARIRRLAAELVRQSAAREDDGLVPQATASSRWLILRRAAAWVRQFMAPARAGTPPS